MGTNMHSVVQFAEIWTQTKRISENLIEKEFVLILDSTYNIFIKKCSEMVE